MLREVGIIKKSLPLYFLLPKRHDCPIYEMVEKREESIKEKFKKDGLELWIPGHPIYVLGRTESHERWEWTVVKEEEQEDDLKMLRLDLDYPEATTDTRESRVSWLERNYANVIRDCKDDLDKGLGIGLEDLL